MIILNLGCGNHLSDDPRVVNIDWSMNLRIRHNPLLRPFAKILLGARPGESSTSEVNIRVHNLAKGIPFDTGSVDVAYHSHMLEHLDPPVARRFLLDVHRVLKPGGLHRVVVPDLESLCRQYINHLEQARRYPCERPAHDRHIGAIIEQCVRREAYATARQRQPRRLLENLLLGDARARGETHQWMYDRISLADLLEATGFGDVHSCGYFETAIEGWESIGLDCCEDGSERKQGSLYMEARKLPGDPSTHVLAPEPAARSLAHHFEAD